MLTACPEDLPNPHKNCIREMLNTLICNDHDVKRLNMELRNLQLELRTELEQLETKCGEEKKQRVCESVEDMADFAKRIASVDEVKQHYAVMCEGMRKRRDNIILYAGQCMLAYNEEKCKFKSFHENTVDYIKRTATLSHDREVIAKCEKDICEMHKRFVKEVANLKRCESELQPFFKLLRESDPKAHCECCCFKDYDWLPKGDDLHVVDAYANQFKSQMGTVLVRAFAQLHLHWPQDSRSFLAGYLMNLDRNEQEVKEKLNIFKATVEAEPPALGDPGFHCDPSCVDK